MLWLTTFVLAGSALAASTLAGKKRRRRKSTCRTWLAASQRDRDRGKRTPGSLLRDGLQKTLEPLFGQTHSRPLRASRSPSGLRAMRPQRVASAGSASRRRPESMSQTASCPIDGATARVSPSRA